MQMRPYRTTRQDGRRRGASPSSTSPSPSGSRRSAAHPQPDPGTPCRRADGGTGGGRPRIDASRAEERQRTEEMLRQSQKLEAVGKLTGGIAHDFNNLLGVIIGNVEFLLEAVPGPTRGGRAGARDPGQRAERGGTDPPPAGVRRQQPLQPRRIDLNALLQGQVTMLRRILGETIQVTATLAPDLWLTSADPSQIGDALAQPGAQRARCDAAWRQPHD